MVRADQFSAGKNAVATSCSVSRPRSPCSAIHASSSAAKPAQDGGLLRIGRQIVLFKRIVRQVVQFLSRPPLIALDDRRGRRIGFRPPHP